LLQHQRALPEDFGLARESETVSRGISRPVVTGRQRRDVSLARQISQATRHGAAVVIGSGSNPVHAEIGSEECRGLENREVSIVDSLESTLERQDQWWE
jgi:hypothetical protein